MDPLLLTIAFLLGFGVRQVGLPPLVGFLLAGFGLHAMGAESGPFIETIADLGVTMLLFTIGLKLRVQSLLRPEVWGAASIHMMVTVILFTVLIYALKMAGVVMFSALDLSLSVLIAFALSFSSTVFAVKILEDKAEMSAFHGRVAIGILIMQDLFAVIFLTVSAGKVPSLWALVLLPLLWLLRPVLYRMMDRCGHGELLVLYGFFLALVVGAADFELVGLKGDLGALVLGIMMAPHPKASEMAKGLMAFKDLFLVGFFLSIGLKGMQGWQPLLVAGLLVVLVPFKVALFFGLMTRFRLRARTALLGALSLANYSEFGLIVGAIGVANGWFSSQWLVVIAIALSFTFILASPLNAASQALYERWQILLKRFETPTRHPTDQPIDPGPSQVAIFGMGRVGTAAYDTMRAHCGEVVIGVDHNGEAVRKHQTAGRKVVKGDPTDPDFWARLQTSAEARDKVRLCLLALPKHAANLAAARQLVKRNFPGLIVATAQFDDQVAELEAAGVHAAYNFYSEAGLGFADHALQVLRQQEI